MVGLLCLKRACSLASSKVTLTAKATTISSSSSSSSLVHSHPYKAFSSISKPTPQNQLPNSSLTLHPFHHHLLPWRPKPSSSQPRLSLAGNYFHHGRLLSFPLLAKQIWCFTTLNNTHYFKVSAKTLLDYCRLWMLFRAQVPKPRAEFGSSFDLLNRWKLWFNRFKAEHLILGLVIINVAVFTMWRIADLKFMTNNFTISVDNIRNGRVHTMITSAFSHISLEHLICNVMGLAMFGINIGRIFGPAYLLKLYLAGAIGGSTFCLVHHAILALSSKGKGEKDPSKTPALGASAAVYAVMMLDILLHPTATIYIDFVIPVPAMFVGILLMGKDILRIIQGNSHISGSAHLGGVAVAAIAWSRIRKGRFL
ncbi:RHOMBOID-like protein 12, mitochondrial [Durio zibethinus]|uniref:RHOMBOID-like protein 12, mitochondrial n=1 Tax=Durio zibethinus TaxID=66656 RepID=A0A6P5YAF9_DURZI|nr:RHOMBOID-like protein 12, mitochondrial [Durio zibethinus]